MAWVCYLLQCGDGSLYAGVTVDLWRRLAQHARGRASKYTRARLPVRLHYAEPHPDRGAALRREAEIRRWPRARKLRLGRDRAS